MPVQADAQGDICIAPLPPEAQCNAWRDSIAYVQLPNFGLCPIKVNVRIRECSYLDPICNKIKWIVQFYVGGIDWDMPHPDDEGHYCEGLTKYLLPGWPDNFGDIRVDRLQEIYKDVQEILADQIFANFYNSSNPINQQSMQCAEPDCQLPGSCSAFTVYYSMPKCVAFCWGSCTFDGVQRFYVNQMSCTETLVCCEHKRRYCYCPATQEIKVSETITTQTGSCEGSTFDPSLCPLIATHCEFQEVTNCAINCED